MAMTAQTSRDLLKVASLTYLLLYVFIGGIVFITSGPVLFSDPSVWYSLIVPPLYATVCALWAFGALDGRLPRPTVIALHVIALPALTVSFLGLGLLLPFLAFFRWRAASLNRRGRTAAVGNLTGEPCRRASAEYQEAKRLREGILSTPSGACGNPNAFS
jgi:hypothetical protein